MLLAQWRQMGQEAVVRVSGVPQRLHHPFQVSRVPEHDGGDHQVEAAGTVALVLEAAVAQFTQPVEEHGAGQRILGLALVQTDLYPAAQLDVLQPVEREQSALDAAEFAQR